MVRITHLGPAAIVASTLVATLLAGPGLVRSVVRADTEIRAQEAAVRLGSGGILEQISNAQQDVAVAVEPSVVHVSSEGAVRGPRGFRMASTGSGWIWDEAGHIVTNAHVVEAADRIEVQLFDGEVRTGEVVGRDLRSDIAIVKIPGGGLIPARRGDSREVRQGQMIFAFGSPFDFRFSMSSGIVSGLGRSAGLVDIDYENFIQVDAAINPGNSGGPLTDVAGRVIGMNTAIATGRGNSVGQGQFAGIGLAIPMSQIQNVVEQVIENGDIRKGFLGVGLSEASRMDMARRTRDASSRFLALADTIQEEYEGDGVVITRVVSGYPAERAGLQGGDIVETVDGRRVRGLEQLKSMISSVRPGDPTMLGVQRFDSERDRFEMLEIEVVLGELDLLMASSAGISLRRLGLESVKTATSAQARQSGVAFRRGALLIEVAADSRLSRDFPAGTIITEVDGRAISSADEMLARLDRAQAAGRDIVLLGVRPDGESRRLELVLSIR